MQKVKLDDDFLHSIAYTICKAQKPKLAAEIFSGTLEIMGNKLSENLQNSLLPLSQTSDINIKV